MSRLRMVLARNQRRYLARHACGWCDHRLDREGCGALYQQCTEEVRAKRRADCLKAYKPRKLFASRAGIEQ